MIKTAVVILSWKGADILPLFLPSVVRSAAGEDCCVYVADNGSGDGTLELLERDFPSVRRIALDKNYGFPQGYNLALAQVEAQYYVLLNSDVEVTPGWLQPLVAYMDAHPRVAACQPKLLSYKHKNLFEYAGAAGGYIDGYGYPFCRGRIFDTVEEDRGQYDEPARLLWATGAALFIRSRDYHEAGGLDSRFFAHMEEIDLCWRLRARDREIVCVPSSVVYHVGGATLSKGNPQKTFLNFRNNLLMLYKNLPPDTLRRVMRVRALLDYVAALKFLVTGHIGDFKAVMRARREYKKMRPSFEEARRENLEKAVAASIPQIFSFSLLWQYYVRGKKKFSQISQGDSHKK